MEIDKKGGINMKAKVLIELLQLMLPKVYSRKISLYGIGETRMMLWF